MSGKKMGRPTAEPKPHMIYARISDEDLETLKDYCYRKNIKQPEEIRESIKGLKNK